MCEGCDFFSLKDVYLCEEPGSSSGLCGSTRPFPSLIQMNLLAGTPALRPNSLIHHVHLTLHLSRLANKEHSY